MGKTTIQLEKTTQQRLVKFGRFHSTYDSIITELMDHFENCQFKGKKN